MKIVSALVSLISAAALVNAVATVAEKDLPKCALLCLETEILASSCPLTNVTCQCTNEALVSAISTCVTANCTLREALTTKAFTENECGAPIRNNSAVVVIAALVGMALAFLAFVFRMISRYTGAGGNFWWDDAVMCLVMGLTTPLSAFSVVLTSHGLGRDVWTLNFDQITSIAYIYMWDELIYLSALPLIKISILLLYLRIFPDQRFRLIVWISVGLCSGYLISFVSVSIWQCRPIRGAWEAWDGEFEGHCNNINLQGWTSAAFNILLDLIVFILPLPSLYKMKMSMQNKFSIMVMFCVGFFLTIVSVIRLTTLLEFGGTNNMTWDYVSVGYWSTIEIHVGIIVACAPACRALFNRIFPDDAGKAQETHTARSDFTRNLGPEKGQASVTISKKPKTYDASDFVPLVDLESGDRSNVNLLNTPSSPAGSNSDSMAKELEPASATGHRRAE